MKKYKLIIFDLDGTLVDSSKGIIECHLFANESMGKPINDKKLLDGIIGGPLLATYQDRFGYELADARKAVEIYRKHYAQVGITGSKLYPDIKNILNILKEEGYLLAVATLKQEEFAKKILSYLGVDTLFDVIHGVDNNDTLTKQDLIEMCIHELNTTKQESILIGDSLHDALGAETVNIDFIGVTYGFGFKNQEDICKYKNIGMAENANDILKFL